MGRSTIPAGASRLKSATRPPQVSKFQVKEAFVPAASATTKWTTCPDTTLTQRVSAPTTISRSYRPPSAGPPNCDVYCEAPTTILEGPWACTGAASEIMQQAASAAILPFCFSVNMSCLLRASRDCGPAERLDAGGAGLFQMARFAAETKQGNISRGINRERIAGITRRE